GSADQNAGVWFNVPGEGLVKRPVTIEFAGLASQATGPALDGTEMSARGRTFPKLGKKMLSLTPLGKQLVHPGDSVLGPLSQATVLPSGKVSSDKGLRTTYSAMIQAAFQDNLWNSPLLTPDGNTQMESNFALFWGLSIQLYEATLISDQTPFDKWLGGDTTAMTAQEKSGFNLFMGISNCGVCHAPSIFAEIPKFLNFNDHLLIELMWTSDGSQVIYDAGFQNTGVSRTSDDIGRGGVTPFVNPRTGQPYPLSWSKNSQLQRQNLLPFPVPLLPFHIPTEMQVNVNGAFKMPGLRNVELTAPYFHNGSVMTLEDVVDFYVRGGNFPAENLGDLDPLVGAGLPLLRGKETMQADIVTFLKALTDPRVRNESAPFDHPELIVPNGDPEMIRIPARDAFGNAALTTLTINPVVSPTTSSAQTITGTVEDGLTPEVTVDTAAVVGAVTVTGTDWSASISGLVQGVNTITVSVTDAIGTTVRLTTAISVVRVAPVITSAAVTTGSVGVSYSYDVNATDANDGDVLSYSLVTAPAGMTIAGDTGLISWAPSAAGAFGVSVRATDPGGLFATQSFLVNVRIPAPAFSVSGRVTKASGGAAMAGVTMTLGGAGSGTVMTDALGNYTFTGLVAGSYIITPSFSGWRFLPVSRTVNVSSRNLTGLTYSGYLIPVRPAAPSGLTAEGSSTARIQLSWTDNADNETRFLLERKVEGGAWVAVASLSANKTSFISTGLVTGRVYYYRIRAQNSAGYSDYSNEASATAP
ncbi:MAG: fibronectin type III domain-containing protein, partial [Chloroflexi bacterium]|nr:fibronectin type III domain-containing protein [Chloroflexota bacterium]